MLIFDKFAPGADLGTVSFDVNDSHLAAWRALFPGEQENADALPPGLVISLMMRGYMHILGMRPEGNVHAGQDLHWFGPVPMDSVLVVGLTCLRKELRNERRWVWLENSVRGETGHRYLRGTMRTLWAR